MDISKTINQLHLYRFRGFHDVTLDNLSQVNVLVGANNCGKTSVLEAIHLMSNPSSFGLLLRLSNLRARASSEAKKKNRINYLLSMFQRFFDSETDTTHYRIKLEVELSDTSRVYEADGVLSDWMDASGEETQALDLTMSIERPDTDHVVRRNEQIINGEDQQFLAPQKNLYRSIYVHSSVNPYRASVQYLSDYIIRERKDTILEMLQRFDPTIDDISIVGEDVYLHNSTSGTLPLFAYGSGMQKAVSLTALIASSKSGVLLIDEIDNTIHVSAFEDVFRWLLDACAAYRVQAFITTHSLEALDAILRVSHERFPKDDLLRIITLRKDYESQTTRCRTRTGEEAYLDRERFGLELRV